MTMMSDAKLKEKLTCGFKYDMKDTVNFYPTTQKSESFTSISYFCPKYFFLFLMTMQKLLKSRLLLKKMTNFKGKLLQNYKQLECEIFRMLVIYQCFFNLHKCNFKSYISVVHTKTHSTFISMQTNISFTACLQTNQLLDFHKADVATKILMAFS